MPEQVDDVCEEEVKKVFSSIKEGKSAGPDGVHGKLIKRCSEQLAGIFTTIYQMLINLKMFPTSWKLAKIIPVPKTQHARELNDFRPIALTPILAKCFEKIIRKRLLTDVSKSLDPLQFPYKAKRGAEDACITLFNLISSHLEKTQSYLRILFIDFSSAFNTVEALMILKRLADLDVNSSLILVIRDFLRERPQRVCLNGFLSDSTVLSTGCPQGCCLSPILFSIYTDFMKCNTNFTFLLKFADGMALVGLLKEEESLSSYFEQANMLIKWCEDSFLHLNVKKTKELVINSIGYDKPCLINNESVEIVPYFKYLGSLLDSKYNLNENTNFIFKKATNANIFDAS